MTARRHLYGELMQMALRGSDELRIRTRSQAWQDLPAVRVPLLRAPLNARRSQFSDTRVSTTHSDS